MRINILPGRLLALSSLGLAFSLALAGMVVTGVLSVLTVNMPMKLGLLLSVIAGGAVAVAADVWRSARAT